MHEENCQEESTNNEEGDFPKSLEQLQELLTSGEVRDEVETPSKSPPLEENSVSITELEEAVADIEQFLRNQNKSES